jgi:hypothetical protein
MSEPSIEAWNHAPGDVGLMWRLTRVDVDEG